jgi:serine/threonine protein kinase
MSAGKYQLEARLGGGGMAEVFVGKTVGAEGFTRRVAIKRVLPGFSDNEAFAKMFVAEAQISSRLVHPNIVSVIDFDRDPEQRLFLVMEMVEGKDLDALSMTGPLPVPVVIYVISEVLRGLGYAHDLPVGSEVRGVVHRDVSPHNVLLSWDGSVKVSDFGIAKARAASEATASVFIKGKPAYMSPEQANGLALDGRSDLFAVGIMLWEMLVGHRLFVGNDTRSTLAAVLFGQIPRPRAQRPDVPKDVERVCMKLLERDMPVRYATAEEVVNDLLECESAPRNGRAMLAQLLAERYPHDAPVRQSMQRARAAGASQPPPLSYTPQPAGPAVTTLPMPMPLYGAPPQPGVALPSLGAAMAAPTGVMEPAAAAAPSSGAGKKLALVVLITAISGGATFAVVSTMKHDAVKPAIDAAVARVTDAAPAIAPAVASDAAVTIAPDAAPITVDATITAPQPRANGLLTVTRYPIVTVAVDGRTIGDTPINNYKLPSGVHTLRITNPDDQVDQSMQITIEPNQLTTKNLGGP